MENSNSMTEHEQVATINNPSFESSWGPIGAYFLLMYKIIRHPGVFFKNIPKGDSPWWPVTFALITSWLGRTIEYFWQGIISPSDLLPMKYTSARGTFFSGFDISSDSGQMAQQVKDGLHALLLGPGGVLLDPFFTLVSIFGSALMIWIGVKLFLPYALNSELNNNETENRSKNIFFTTLRVIGYANAAAIFSVVPIMGNFISKIGIFAFCWIGIIKVFRTSGIRALVILLIPQLLGFTLIMLSVVFFAVLIIKMFIAL